MQENISQIERQKRFVIRFLYWGIMIGTLLFLGKYLIPVLFPFMIAFIVAGMLNKPIHYISKKLWNPAFSWKIFNSCSVSVYDCFYCSRNVE